MAIIEGFRVQNFRALRDVTLGKLSGEQVGDPLTPFTVVIGKNGVGKSTLFDAFGFVADCLATDVETACDMKQRGGLVPRRFVWNLTARIHRSGARWGLWATRQSELSTNPPGGAFC